MPIYRKYHKFLSYSYSSIFVPILSGFALSTAFAPRCWWWMLLAVVPWVMSLWCIEQQMQRPDDQGDLILVPAIPKRLATYTNRELFWKGARRGYLFGFVFFLLNLSWLQTVTTLGQVALVAYLACYWAILGGILASVGNPLRGKNPILRISAVALLWMGLEWLRGWLLTGFGWNGIGVAAVDFTWLSQMSDLFGVTGYSALILWVIVMTAWIFVDAYQCSEMTLELKPLSIFAYFLPYAYFIEFSCLRDKRRAVLCLIAVLGGFLGYGAWRVQGEETRAKFPLRALLVQLNIPQEAAERLVDPEEVRMGFEDETLAGLAEAKASGKLPDWVIWPEAALDGRLLRLENEAWTTWTNNLETFARIREGQPPFTLILGLNEGGGRTLADGQVEPDGSKLVWNSLISIDSHGKLQSFRKHHLVIFGETIPGMDAFPFLRNLYEKQTGVEFGGSYAEGTSFEPLPMLVRGKEVDLIGSVCFEDTVPRLTRKMIRAENSQLIVNITNDGWFKTSQAAMQHFQNARIRCIELRRPMVRCANTGVSGVVDSSGRVQAKLVDKQGNHFTRGHLLVNVDVPVKPGGSLYALWGDWPCMLGGLVALLVFGREFRKQDEEPRVAQNAVELLS